MFKRGDYVRFTHDFDIFPHALVKAGERGIVMCTLDPVSVWLLDSSHEGLDEWNNCAHVPADEAGQYLVCVAPKPVLRHFNWLVRIYDAWLERHNLEPLSADELMATDVTPAQRRWLARYCDLWDRCFIG